MHTLADRIVHIENTQASADGPGVNIGDQLRAQGWLPENEGTVIDLSNAPHHRPRRGGHDPEVPQVLTSWRVAGPFLTGHTADYSDPDAPIIVRAGTEVRPGPDGLAFAEGRCPGCVARPVIAIGDDQTIMVLEHEPGCPVMAELLREAGVAR